MTIVVRRIDATWPLLLGAAGVCRVGLCEVVGCWGSGPIRRVVFLGGGPW